MAQLLWLLDFELNLLNSYVKFSERQLKYTANPSLCSISNKEKPVFINWEPCNEKRFLPVRKYYTGKTLFWPCTGPVMDCSDTVDLKF